jgi:hypothetical protein
MMQARDFVDGLQRLYLVQSKKGQLKAFFNTMFNFSYRLAFIWAAVNSPKNLVMQNHSCFDKHRTAYYNNTG